MRENNKFTKEIKYLQIEEEIIELIRDGYLKPGDKVDSESTLKKRYSVSAITVRKAFSDLINKGYLHGIQGLGTFVSNQPMVRKLTSLSFSEELIQQNYSIDLVVDSITQIQDEQLAQKLEISKFQEITCIKRVRLANDVPVAYHISYVDSRKLNMEQASEIYKYKSFYKTMNAYGLYPVRATENYSISNITNENILQRMKIKRNEAAFLCKRTTYDKNDLVIEYAETLFNKDWFSVSVVIQT